MNSGRIFPSTVREHFL